VSPFLLVIVGDVLSAEFYQRGPLANPHKSANNDLFYPVLIIKAPITG
jgi:hypothetical protein